MRLIKKLLLYSLATHCLEHRTHQLTWKKNGETNSFVIRNPMQQGILDLFGHAISGGNSKPKRMIHSSVPELTVRRRQCDKTPNIVRWNRGEYADPDPLYPVV